MDKIHHRYDMFYGYTSFECKTMILCSDCRVFANDILNELKEVLRQARYEYRYYKIIERK